jgi:hypothetical protein
VIRKQRMAAVLLALALVSSGCHKKVAHPNAINNFGKYPATVCRVVETSAYNSESK